MTHKKDKNYWKRYPALNDPEEIERALSVDTFISEGTAYELVQFYQGASADNFLITPGSGGHAYVFAELAYLLYLKGYNVFVMPRHGGYTIMELVRRHQNAVEFIRSKHLGPLHLYGEGLWGLVIFYLALAGSPVQSIMCENAPAILTDQAFHDAMKRDGAAGKRRRVLLPIFRILAKLLPTLPVPLYSYLDWTELVNPSDASTQRVEALLVQNYLGDPDFDTHYPLRAVLSLVNTPPPAPLSALAIPTLFILAAKGMIPSYFKVLFAQLLLKTKKLTEVDGSAYWMLSHPQEAADIIDQWIAEVDTFNQTITHSIFDHANN